MSRSYQSPNSQLPYCDEYHEAHNVHESELDQIQREAEQELQYAERILSAADDLVAENRDCFIRRGYKKTASLRNMPEQPCYSNYPQVIQDPCQMYANQDMPYYTQDPALIGQYEHRRHIIPSPTPGPPNNNRYNVPTAQLPSPYPQYSQWNAQNGPAYCNDQNVRMNQCISGRQQEFSSNYSDRGSAVRSNQNKDCCEKYNKNDIEMTNRSCRKDTCPSYTCSENDENICKKFDVCEKGVSQQKAWPKKPAATQDELSKMIESESRDVDLTLSLTAHEKKTYKKPCPKQQKAQMSVQQILQAHEGNKYDCLKEYGPLSEPDPEDISPDLAASMMFAQEEGIKLDACPQNTIQHLYPEDKKNQSKIPGSTISFVDHKLGKQGDKEKLVENSSKVSDIGASDSAYTKTMKKKGSSRESKKFVGLDGSEGGNKKEYLLVPLKPDRFNMIQVRGNAPTWFPGYFTGFPEVPGIRILDSPSKVLNRAWIFTNPADVPSSDIKVVD